MTTKTITITDLADVLPGDMVTAEYVPIPPDRGARIVGEASQTITGALIVGGHYLLFDGGKADTSLRFVSATREVPAWEPDEDLCDWLADQLEDYEAFGGEAWDSASAILTKMHDNGWRNDTPAESEPVDPVMDETDKRDRIDCGGYKWEWWGGPEVWKLGDYTARGNLAALDRHYGPLRFADEETEAMNNDKAGE